MFWVISVYFNIRNTLPKFCLFLLGHSVYMYMLEYAQKYPSRTLHFGSISSPISPVLVKVAQKNCDAAKHHHQLWTFCFLSLFFFSDHLVLFIMSPQNNISLFICLTGVIFIIIYLYHYHSSMSFCFQIILCLQTDGSSWSLY